MSEGLNHKVKKIGNIRILKKKWQKALAGLMAVTFFGTAYSLMNPAISMEKTLCGFEEHTHSVEEGCFEERKELFCTLEEDGHTHAEDCYEVQSVLTCTETEGEGHAHSEECYEETEEVTCNLTEGEGHAHSEECMDEEGNVICGIEESDGHIHDDSCLSKISTLVCGLEETDGHVHGTECSSEQSVLVCGKAETDAVHVHDENCYNTLLSLICEKEEHTHDGSCYADSSADVETAEVWEATFSDVELSEDWGSNVVAIAKSQLGYTESKENYVTDGEDGVRGYTRYGAWYGDPYGDWCAMFASFVYHYAGVKDDVMPGDCNVVSWINKLEDMQIYYRTGNADETEPESVYEPKPGDLVFFDYNTEDGTDFAEHVGLVIEVERDEEDNWTGITTIEGNYGDRVAQNSYSANDKTILGYGSLPENLQTTLELAEGAVLERSVPYLNYVACAESEELLGYYLSSTVRILVPVDLSDKTFVQAVPSEEDMPNDTFYRFGYNAPGNAYALYESNQPVVYTAYASPMEYRDQIVVSYRVFGSVEGEENSWYFCDESGNITHRVEERAVEWDLGAFNVQVPGVYTLFGTIDGIEKADEETPALRAELNITLSEMQSVEQE